MISPGETSIPATVTGVFTACTAIAPCPAETPLRRFKRAYTDAQIAESRCNIDELGIRKCQVRTMTHFKVFFLKKL